MSTATKKPRNSKTNWTPEQEEFLLESYGISSIQYLMDRIGKSYEAIKLKHQELTGSCDVKEAAGRFSTREVAGVLGVDHRTINTWIKNHDFPAKQLYKLRRDTKRRRYSVDAQEVWKWVKKNKERIKFSNVERGILLPEPDWLDEEVKKALSKPIKRQIPWTKEEDERAWSLWQQGYSGREVAKYLKRPEKGTQKRLTIIGKRKREEVKKAQGIAG